MGLMRRWRSVFHRLLTVFGDNNGILVCYQERLVFHLVGFSRRNAGCFVQAYSEGAEVD